MKKTTSKQLVLAVLMAYLLAGCTDRISSGYILDLPEVPPVWITLLGEPHWRIEWFDPDGQEQVIDLQPGCSPEIEIPVTWTNPVLAWPYWPSFNLSPGIFKPCGALFPYDVPDQGNQLRLSWEAGVDAIFYRELAFAYGSNDNANVSRTPANFDWPRFRELFKTEALGYTVREDPWVVNWRTVAERTIESNFDRRRIVPEAVIQRQLPVPAGTWYGTSPFATPLEQPVFPVRPGLNVWISEEGILRVSGNTWVFTEIKNF